MRLLLAVGQEPELKFSSLANSIIYPLNEIGNDCLLVELVIDLVSALVVNE